MKVFKFGGASVKDAAAIRNTVNILRLYTSQKLLVVVSAMGKTTNALERILHLAREEKDYRKEFLELKKFHDNIVTTLFSDPLKVLADTDAVFDTLDAALKFPYGYDKLYDQVISKGEIISSLIIHHFMAASEIKSVWVDARMYIITDESYREGKVNWDLTCSKIQRLKETLESSLVITQGFIGSTTGELTTTLGREGSDFSAAIFASCLGAESVTIWKDVPGVMSADPKRLPDAVIFKELPYKEAAEMTYYGASVIHPKTIRPLAVKDIPLYVKNFDNPALPGTIIHDCQVEHLPPLIVFKENQCLISCNVTDFTFINEHQISLIFHALSELDLKINMMQNSAISFSFCVDYRERKLESLIHKLKENFEVHYNTELTLITVKNYDNDTFNTYRKREGVLMEQSSRSTLQVLVKSGTIVA